jgi:hypothetical protein
MNNYEIGQYGYFEFTLKKKVYGNVVETPFKMYGKIIDIDRKYVLIEDCYMIPYMPAKENITTFTQLDKPNETDVKLTNIKQ